MNLDLSPRQSATVAAALTAVASAVIVAVVLGVFYLFVQFATTFSSVFLPLFIAMLLAFVLQPFYRVFEKRLPPVAAVALVFLTILLPLVLFVWFFAALVITQVSELVARMPELTERARSFTETNWPQVRSLWDQYEMAGRLQNFVTEQADALWSAFQGVMQSAATAFRSLAGALSWVVMPVYLAFFLMTPPLPGKDWGSYMPFLKKETRGDVVYLVQEFINILVSFFRGQLIVAAGQGLLFAIGFALAGLQYGIIIGILLGFVNIIPYLGSMIGLAIALPLAFFQPGGGTVTLGLVILVFVIVQLIEGYILTPKVMGDRTGLHPLVIMVALFFWGTAFDGIAGMILAIPLTAFLVVFWRLAKTKYIKEIV